MVLYANEEIVKGNRYRRKRSTGAVSRMSRVNTLAIKGEGPGIIKMDLWELPPIDPSKHELSKSFAESIGGVPGVNLSKTFLGIISRSY